MFLKSSVRNLTNLSILFLVISISLSVLKIEGFLEALPEEDLWLARVNTYLSSFISTVFNILTIMLIFTVSWYLTKSSDTESELNQYLKAVFYGIWVIIFGDVLKTLCFFVGFKDKLADFDIKDESFDVGLV